MDCIDLRKLLAPYEDDRPSGDDLEYDPLFGEMERAAKGKEEQQFGDTIVAAEEPDWARLESHALAVLERSKDLRAAVQLTRALIRTQGHAGLASALSLIRGYVEGFWQTLYPLLDPDDGNDPAIRLNTLLNLCDPIEFLLPISKLPLVSSNRMGQYSLRDIQIASGTLPLPEPGEKHITSEQIEAAFREAEPDRTQATESLIEQSLDAVAGIVHAVNGHLGDVRFFDLQPLADVLNLAARELASRTWSNSPAPADRTAPDGDGEALSGSASANRTPGSVNSREEVIHSIDRICRYYAQHEPSSPVPLLLQRAKRLATMGFQEIVQDLAPDSQSHFDFLWRQGDG